MHATITLKTFENQNLKLKFGSIVSQTRQVNRNRPRKAHRDGAVSSIVCILFAFFYCCKLCVLKWQGFVNSALGAIYCAKWCECGTIRTIQHLINHIIG